MIGNMKPRPEHDNMPCCGCGPHCLDTCFFIHISNKMEAFCIELEKDLFYYDGGFLAKCFTGVLCPMKKYCDLGEDCKKSEEGIEKCNLIPYLEQIEDLYFDVLKNNPEDFKE